MPAWVLATASATVPPVVATIVQRTCVRCHDADNTLDLRVLPAPSETRTWMKMLSQVESSKMPPPEKGSTVAQRFPLDPADRQALVEGIEQVLGATLVTTPPQRHLSRPVWASILADVAATVLPPRDFSRVVPAGDLDFGTPLAPLDQVRIADTAHALCSTMAHVRLLPVAALFTSVYGEAPSRQDLHDAAGGDAPCARGRRGSTRRVDGALHELRGRAPAALS